MSKTIYYIDSNSLMYLLETSKNPAYAQAIEDILDCAEKGDCEAHTSMVSVAEVAFADHEKNQKLLDAAVEARLKKLWHPESPLKVIDAHEKQFRRASQLLRHYAQQGWSKTKGLDAVHLAAAEEVKATEFIATEKAMEKWGSVCGFRVCKPHRHSKEGLFDGHERATQATGTDTGNPEDRGGEPGLEGSPAPRAPEEEAGGGLAGEEAEADRPEGTA